MQIDDATNCPAEECGEGTVEAVLTMSDSFGDGWNGRLISVVVDGVVVVDMASASGIWFYIICLYLRRSSCRYFMCSDNC